VVILVNAVIVVTVNDPALVGVGSWWNGTFHRDAADFAELGQVALALRAGAVVGEALASESDGQDGEIVVNCDDAAKAFARRTSTGGWLKLNRAGVGSVYSRCIRAVQPLEKSRESGVLGRSRARRS